MTQRDLRRLFEAIARKDWESAVAFGDSIATAQETRGNRASARLLKDALRANTVAVPLPQPVSSLGLSLIRVSKKLADIELVPKTRKQIEALIKEHRAVRLLRAKGFEPRRKVIFSGPPGCGKSLTAGAIANELSLDFYVVRMDAVIGSYLGQTATNLRKLFSFAESNPCVVLFDELDALGRTRGNSMDVGELDRVVIALMQELEFAQPLGLILASSNLPKSLDHALWRRFETHVSLERPGMPALRAFCLKIAKKFDGALPPSVIIQATKQPSYAEAERVIVDHFRAKALSLIGDVDGVR